MLDIMNPKNGEDLPVANSEAPRAGNVLAVQIGDLEYAQDFGIDLAYFLESEFQIQNESFKSYCVQRLLESNINVVNVQDVVRALFTEYNFQIGSSENTSGGFVA